MKTRQRFGLFLWVAMLIVATSSVEQGRMTTVTALVDIVLIFIGVVLFLND